MPAAVGLTPGTMLLHTYRIVRLINRGGMGEIYQAEHLDQNTQHAIKIILPELVGDESIAALFLREAEALRKVRHDAVVGYDGLFRDETGRLHLVMEYVDGPSLRDRIDSGALTPEEVARLRDRLAEGLAVAHDRGIFHRDVSPDNIILEHGALDRAKVIDFGIAKLTDTTTQTVIGEGFAGKMAWASPEQVGLFGGQVDARSDIYSLGLVLAAAARGRPLDMGRTMMATIEARKTVPPLDGVPPGLAAQIRPMLAPDPLDRPPSMRSLVKPPAATPAAERQQPARPGLPRPRLWMAVAPVAIAAIAGGVWWVSEHPELIPGFEQKDPGGSTGTTTSPPVSPPPVSPPPPSPPPASPPVASPPSPPVSPPPVASPPSPPVSPPPSPPVSPPPSPPVSPPPSPPVSPPPSPPVSPPPSPPVSPPPSPPVSPPPSPPVSPPVVSPPPPLSPPPASPPPPVVKPEEALLNGPLAEPTSEALQRIVQLLSPDQIYKMGLRYLSQRQDANTALALWFEASDRGSGNAALGIARFYDPDSWDQGAHPFSAPNPDRACYFYRLASDRKIAAAEARLAALCNGSRTL